MKKYTKPIKRLFKKAAKRENLIKIVVLFSTLALLATSILPFLV